MMNQVKTMKKQTLSVALSFAIVISMIASLLTPLKVYAYSGSDYTSNTTISSRLNTLFSNYQPGASQFNITFDGGSQCFGYAMYAQSILFGKTEKLNVYNSYGNNISYVKSYPTNTYASGWSSLPTGTHIRGTSPSGGMHSIILLKTTSSNITYVDANGDGQNTNNVVLHTMAWSTFFTYYVSSISYASYPSAATYPTSGSTTPLALVSGGTYIIQNVATGNYVNCWADSSAQIVNSTRVTTYPTASEATQYFTIYIQSDGSYKIMPYSTGYAINCTYRTNGTLNTYDPNLDLETWYVNASGSNFKVQLKNNTTMYWTASSSVYANITLSGNSGNDYQTWSFIRIY